MLSCPNPKHRRGKTNSPFSMSREMSLSAGVPFLYVFETCSKRITQHPLGPLVVVHWHRDVRQPF